MKFSGEDNGNCRVYYKSDDGKALYCWQNEGRQGWAFYRCSKDGEPSHNVSLPDLTPLPPGKEAIGKELIQFLKIARISLVGENDTRADEWWFNNMD